MVDILIMLFFATRKCELNTSQEAGVSLYGDSNRVSHVCPSHCITHPDAAGLPSGSCPLCLYHPQTQLPFYKV